MKEAIKNYLKQEGIEEKDILSPLFTEEMREKRMKFRGINIEKEIEDIEMPLPPKREPGARRPNLPTRKESVAQIQNPQIEVTCNVAKNLKYGFQFSCNLPYNSPLTLFYQ